MLDYDKEFQSFMQASQGSAIQEIYKIIPTLSNEQMKVYLSLKYFIDKYDLHVLQKFIFEYLNIINKNKNLNFLKSLNLKSLLRAYTQEELVRGIKIQSTNNLDDN